MDHRVKLFGVTIILGLSVTLIYFQFSTIFSRIPWTRSFQSGLIGQAFCIDDRQNQELRKCSLVKAQKLDRFPSPPKVDNITTPFWVTLSNAGVTSENISPLYVHVDRAGRLGNNLFEYAACLGVAYRNNRMPLISTSLFASLNKYFNIRSPVLSAADSKEYRKSAKQMWERSYRRYMNETEILPSGRNVTIGQYLQSRLYFTHAEMELRKELKFRKSVLNVAAGALHRLTDVVNKRLNGEKRQSGRTNFTTCVAIHVRRGDIALLWAKTLPKPDYFKRAMAYFRHRYGSVVFIVLSDDISWCRRNVIGPDVVYSEGLSSGEDMALASLCDHVITSHGTFSMWCAWFAGGITIRPIIFNGKNSAQEDPSQVYPPNTIAV